MTITTELRAIRSLIDTPDKWTKGEYARTATGKRAATYAASATCFCLVGATIRAGIGDGAWDLLVRAACPGNLLTKWNDAPERTHTDILEAIDRAIDVAGEDV